MNVQNLCGNCCTNHGDSKRMYPARQTRSTPSAFSAATTSRSCCSSRPSLRRNTRAFNPRCRAVAIPGALALFENQRRRSRASGIRRASMLSAIATKFEPAPKEECREISSGQHHNSPADTESPRNESRVTRILPSQTDRRPAVVSSREGIAMKKCLRRSLLGLVIILVVAGLAYHLGLRNWFLRWGTTPAGSSRHTAR